MAARTSNRLNSRLVKSDLEPGRYADGNSLYLFVREGGTKQWVVRTMVQRKRRDIGLGGFPLVTLAEAREQATEVLRQARRGIDPIAERRKMKAIPTFKSAANAVLEERKPSWKNKKHAQQWLNTLEHYAFPFFGDKLVSEVQPSDVREALLKIWLDKPETSKRVLQRVHSVFQWSIASGYRDSANPTEGIRMALPAKSVSPAHHNSLHWRKMPKLMASLQERSSVTAKALQFTILTACRTSEVLGATWEEIEGDTWTIPARRMKMDREHQVPLSPEAKKILTQLKGLDNQFIFPGARPKRPLSNMTMLKLVKSLAGQQTTVHGFRSSFRDWVDEAGGGDATAAEACLAHARGDAIVKAYARSQLLDRKRKLLDAWGQEITKPQ